MNLPILITGISGSIGAALSSYLGSSGYKIVGLDLHAHGPAFGDIRHSEPLCELVERCCGVIHLAAVSRVIRCEQDPLRCWSTNLDGLHNVLSTAVRAKKRPWVLFASSREVYGQPSELPANEDSPLQPVNVYGRSKLAGEKAIQEAREQGLQVATLRLTNVYGNLSDHSDRVIPALTQRAVGGVPLTITGGQRTFDFVHIDDVVQGVLATVQQLEAGEHKLPPIHLLSGEPITLRQLANTINQAAGGISSIHEVPRHCFDVSHFYGDPSRAKQILGWKPQISIHTGLTRFIQQKKHQTLTKYQEPYQKELL